MPFLQRTSTELERARLEKEAIEAKMAEYSFDNSMCSVASKTEQDLINSLQSRLKVCFTASSFHSFSNCLLNHFLFFIFLQSVSDLIV